MRYDPERITPWENLNYERMVSNTLEHEFFEKINKIQIANLNPIGCLNVGRFLSLTFELLFVNLLISDSS